VRWAEGSPHTDYGYAGQRYDAGSALLFLHARYYDPALGRFISADTIVPEPGAPQDFNRYSYCRNSPLVYTDPSGHIPCIDEECNWVADPVSGNPVWRGDSLEAWRNEIIAALMDGGPECQRIAQHVIAEDIHFSLSRQGTKARWTLGGDIQLSSSHYSLRTSPTDVFLLGSIAEETQHIADGPLLALSIEGEVRGPRARIHVMQELGHESYPVDHPNWQAVIGTPENPTDRQLRAARQHIMAVTNPLDYKVWALPLRPEYYSMAPFVLVPRPLLLPPGLLLPIRTLGFRIAYFGVP
jgi:RHS repeat-associated protein